MAGGLLNLIAVGNQNTILTGNPTKSFFKFKHAKYTNFGMQKHRLDPIAQKDIQLSTDQYLSFKISRYGDLLMDTYLVVTLPNIWSPILQINNDEGRTEFRPYEFKWIKNIGTQLIKEIAFKIDGIEIQKYSGTYIQNMVERDFDLCKKDLFNIMTGNVKELNDPANFNNRNNNYPNAWKINDLSNAVIEPSIRSQQLYIPINSWFTMTSKMAFPLVCLQYNTLTIDFTLRPIVDLFVIKDVLKDNVYIRADQSEEAYGFHRFLNQPPKKKITKETEDYKGTDRINLWNSDIHLLCTQCYLDTPEQKYFALNTQTYLLKEIHEHKMDRIIKNGKLKLESNGLVANWMWYIQRNDVKKRNEWSNYTNWPYEDIIPNNMIELEEPSGNKIYYSQHVTYPISVDISKNIYTTGDEPNIYNQSNVREILQKFAIICDGKYREDTQNSGIFDKVEKYARNTGNAKAGLYCYNFCLDSNYNSLQPSGAFNTNKFKTIELEYNNHADPPIDKDISVNTICDPETGIIIGVTKDPTDIFKYNYDFHIVEERYNVLVFQGGMAGLAYSR